jgi:nucleoside-diphosphate-sugar epimerase
MKTLLIIGGTGFFGKSFLDSFHRGDLRRWDIDKVAVVSRHAESLRILAPQLLDHRIELINLDICSATTLPKADYVIHAASSTDARNYLHQPDIEKYNIETGVHNYCRLAPFFHSESRILYVSSGAVYGAQHPENYYLAESDTNFNYADMPAEKRAYAAAKLEAENAVKRLGIKFGLSISIARCFAFVGPWLPRDQHFAIGNFLQDGIKGRPIKLNAEHEVIRSYMHADDLVIWLMSMVANATPAVEVFNVGSDEEIRLRDLARIIAMSFGVEVHFAPNRSDKVDRYVPSIIKAKKYLNLSVNLDLISGIDKTIARILAN